MALKELSNEPKFVQIGSAISEKHEQDRLCLEKVHIHTHTHTYIHTHTDIFRSRRAESNGV